MGLLTCEGRLAFAFRLFEPDTRVNQKTGESSDVYSVCFMFDKNEKEFLKILKGEIDKAKLKGTSKGMFPKKAWPTLKLPVRDGDAEVKTGDKGEEFKGMWFFNANQSQRKPALRVKENGKIRSVTGDEAEDAIYSGCRAVLAISVYPYNAAGKKGIAVGLEGVLKVGDDDRLDGRMDVDSAFSQFEEETEDSYEDVTGENDTDSGVWD